MQKNTIKKYTSDIVIYWRKDEKKHNIHFHVYALSESVINEMHLTCTFLFLFILFIYFLFFFFGGGGGEGHEIFYSILHKKIEVSS